MKPSAASSGPTGELRANSIGFARFLLATVVVYGHAWYLAGHNAAEPVARWLLAGADHPAGLGVKGFFLLSGYLVFRSERRLASTRRFLWHRAVRIYPAFWVCLAVTGLGFPLVGWLFGNGQPNWADAWGYVWRNLFLMREQLAVDGLFPLVPRAGDLNGSLWTLPYEIGCYVVLATLGWLGLIRPGSLAPWLVILGLVALFVHDRLYPEIALFFKTDGRQLCIWFTLGAFVSLFDPAQVRRLTGGAAAFISGALYCLACHVGLAALAGPFLLVPFFLWLMWGLPLPHFESRVGGDYSYGLYIYAYPVQQALASCSLHEASFALYLVASFLLSLLLAFASWHIVEKHALKLKSLGGGSNAASP